MPLDEKEIIEYLTRSSQFLTNIRTQLLKNTDRVNEKIRYVKALEDQIKKHIILIEKNHPSVIPESILKYLKNFEGITTGLLSEKNIAIDHIVQYCEMIDKLVKLIQVEIENLNKSELPRLKILIGDDCFENDLRNSSKDGIAVIIVLALLKYCKRSEPGPINEPETNNGITLVTGLNTGFDIEFTFVSTPAQIIEAGKNHYDWKITDMNYGHGMETAGIGIANALHKFRQPGEIVAIFTSEDSSSIIKEMLDLEKRHVIDCLVCPSLNKFKGLKSELLGIRIGEWISKRYS